MEATIFTGWIYDHLLPYAAAVKVAHPVMLRAIAASQKKMIASTSARLPTARAVTFGQNATWPRPRSATAALCVIGICWCARWCSMKNRVSGLLLETGVSHDKQRLHKVKYFRELLGTNPDVPASIRPLLKLSRETIVRLQKTDYALLSSLQRDPVLAGRIQNLRTVPGVGPITALTWTLEVGDVSHFHSVKQAISYCGLCANEKSSADKVLRIPLSKQRNKHIQHVWVEAAKLASHRVTNWPSSTKRKKGEGYANRATLAVAPRWWRIYSRWIASSGRLCRLKRKRVAA